jgi:hypothetical protein
VAAITARLIVRRVKDLSRKAEPGHDELFQVWRCHAVFTDGPFTLVQADEQYRDQAQVQPTIPRGGFYCFMADGMTARSFPAVAHNPRPERAALVS